MYLVVVARGVVARVVKGGKYVSARVGVSVVNCERIFGVGLGNSNLISGLG